MLKRRKISSETFTATCGFEAKLWLAADKLRQMLCWQWSGATWTTESCQRGERGDVHQFGVPPMNALRDSAFLQSEASLQVEGDAKDNMAGFVLANSSMSFNQSGEGDTRRDDRKFCFERTSLFSAN